jgi:hypothetical protein
MSDQILIVKNENEKELNKFQRAFNANIQKINDLKLKLSHNTELFEKTRVRVMGEVVPLQHKYLDKHVQLVKLYDRHYEDSFFKKKEKEKLADLIFNKCEELMGSIKDEEFRAIYEKYAAILDPDFEEEENDEDASESEAEQLKAMMERFYGVDLGDVELDPNDPESVERIVREKLEAQQPQKKKSQKQIEREEKQKEEELNVSKAAKSIYKDLVKVFHPDREQDEAEKLRKTEVMKRITAAFQKDDLFELLKLKFELLGSSLNQLTTPDTELKYYNKMLREQINELEGELWQLHSQANGLFPNLPNDFFNFYAKDKQRLDAAINTESNKAKKALKKLESDMLILSEKQNVREYLKGYQIVEIDDHYFF